MASYKEKLKDFMYLETSDNPLVRVENHKILQSIIDPTTGEPYNGIILEGEFASLDVLNNNNRIYTEENYLTFIELLKRQIHSPKGVYGELEHPKGYQTDTNNLSHKILDIWYDKSKKKVFGIIMLLNTPKGLIAQEIVKSGGQIAVSARGGGSEIKNHDGTITAQLKLLITFDIVYHPGFSSAIVEFTKLNENQNFDNVNHLYENGKVQLCIYEPEIGKMSQLYESYINCSNVQNQNFLQWCVTQNLFESESNEEEKSDIKKLEKNKTAEEDNLEQDLQDAVDQQLTESQKTEQNKRVNNLLKNNNLPKNNKLEKALGNAVKHELRENQKTEFHKQMMKANKKLDAAYYDNSAGFMNFNEEEN